MSDTCWSNTGKDKCTHFDFKISSEINWAALMLLGESNIKIYFTKVWCHDADLVQLLEYKICQGAFAKWQLTFEFQYLTQWS